MATLLQLNKIKKSYSQQVIFNEASFSVGEKQKIGVVGRNGAGKSTLFRMILGEEEVDAGEILLFDCARMGSIKQEDDFSDTDIVLDYLIAKTKKEDWQVRKQASFFQLDDEKIKMRIKDLSGGFQMRVKLTVMFLLEPNLLLLDEPTNYLDLSTVFLLEECLKKYKGTTMIISHDRDFLDNVSDETLEVENGSLNYFPQKINDYLVFKAQKNNEYINYNKKQERKIKHLQSYIDRFGVQANKAKQAQSKAKQIKRIKKIDIADPIKKVNILIPTTIHKKGLALRIEQADIGYPEKIIAKSINIDVEKGEHIAVLGDNGHGKTTFLRTIASDLKVLEGSMRWMPNTSIAYYAQHVVSELDPAEKAGDYLERSAKWARTKEDILKIAGDFLFSESDILKSISMLSGGEKARLCLAGILLSNNNVLLLDEPTNHLDFETIEALVNALKKSPITLLFISHNQGFISALADNIIEVHNGSVKRFNGGYNDYVYKLKARADIAVNTGKIEDEKKIEKEARAMEFQQEKERKKTLKSIENKIENKRKRKEVIMKIFIDKPNENLIDLRKELKILESEILDLEGEWLKSCE